MLARFHVEAEGKLVNGAGAFAALWRALPSLSPLGRAARNPVVLWMLAQLYRGFLLVRPRLQRLAHRMEKTMRPQPDPAAPGQESVWSFPRPAIAQPSDARIRIEHAGTVVADSLASVRTLETSHPPSYYIPLADIAPGVLRRAAGASLCEWKGAASYWDVVLDGIVLPRVGWSYADPTPPFAILRDHVAFYAAPFDRCTVNGEMVVPQPGGFYGGWITRAFAGPFKGEPGSHGW